MTDAYDGKKNSVLRKRAERKLQETGLNAVGFSLEDAKSLIHELHVHQIELEIQNEELRISQLALETARRKYLDLYEFSPIGLLILDKNERIQEANLTFVTMLGIDREKLNKRNLSDFIDPSSQDDYHLFSQALYRSQQAQQCEIILLRAKQYPLVVRLDGTVLLQADGFINYRIAVSDITAHHQNEMEIRRLYAAEQEARMLADRTSRWLGSLQQITAALSIALSYEQVSQICLQQSIPILAAKRGEILLLSKDGSSLESSASYDGTHHMISLGLPAAEIFAEVLAQQKPVWVHSIEDYAQRYPQANHTFVDDLKAFAQLPLIVNHQPIGILSYSFSQPQAFPEEDRLFMQALAQQCSQALERVRLSEQARAGAALEERHRLARDLHDSVKQSLFAATLMSERLPYLWERNPESAKTILADVITLNRAALAQMQGVLFELLPESIVKTPISSLLRQLTETVRGHVEITTELEMEGEEPLLPPAVHMAIYRIAQESLNNILKHSQSSQFTVLLVNESDELRLRIHDNGVGFDVTSPHAGMGLDIMRQRAEIIHASLHITSGAGMGTEVKVIWKPVALASN